MASTHRDEISRLELLHAAHPDGLVFPHLADAYRRAGRYRQAEGLLQAGLRRHSDYSSAHVVLGRLRLDQGKHGDAERAFQRVLELDPQNHIALEYLGRLALEQGQLEEALEQFQRLATLKPGAEVEEQVRELEQRVRERDRASRGGVAGRGAVAPPDTAPRRNVPAGGAPANGGPVKGGAHRGDSGGSDDDEEPPPMQLPEPGEVVTETMAELYARQGLHHRAVAVYQQLLQRAPDDQRLKDKLAAAESALRPSGAQDRAEASDGFETADDSGSAAGGSEPSDTVAVATAPAPTETPAEGPRSPRPPERPAERGLEPWEEAAETPAAAEPPVATIRDQLQALLAWEPTPAPPQRTASSSMSPYEPWAAASITGPAEEAAAEAGRSRATDGAPAAPGRAHAPAAERATEPTPDRVAEPIPEPAPASPPAPPARAAVPPAPSTAEPTQWSTAEEQPADPRTRALIALTDMLVGLLEYRDPFFRGSSSLTRLLATNVAEEMGLSEVEQVDLALAAVLRDLGRMALGGRLLTSEGTAVVDARRKIERHVDLALHLLEGIDLPRSVRLAVRHHHERWDGDGYPDGLAGEDIPKLARVLAAADSFAAMVSPRSYRVPRKVSDAAQELREAAGTQYDPAVIDALLRVLERRDQPHLGFDQRPHILLVNPDQPGAVVTAAKLCSAGYLAEVSSDTHAARERLRRVPVSALVVSAEHGEDEAAAFVREIRVDPSFSSLPVVVVDAGSVALRVRLLESGADVCFPPGASYAELRGTLSALVRRTLQASRTDSGEPGEGSSQEAPWLALQGDVEDFPLTWLLQVMKYDSRTAAVGIRAATAAGAIYLKEGDAVHAEIRDGEKGEAALRRMLGWKKGRFTVQPDARPRERTIDTSIIHLLLAQAVDEDHAAAGIFGAVSAES